MTDLSQSTTLGKYAGQVLKACCASYAQTACAVCFMPSNETTSSLGDVSLIFGLRHILLHLTPFQSGALSRFLPLSYQMIAVSCYGLKSTCTAVRSNAPNSAQRLRFSCPEQLFWHHRTVKHPKPCTAVALLLVLKLILRPPSTLALEILHSGSFPPSGCGIPYAAVH